MQDKNPNSLFDKRLEDKGWAQMSHLLDKEMPVSRTEKKNAWLPWFILIGVALFSGAYLWYYLSQEENIEEQAITQSMSIAANIADPPDPGISVHAPPDNELSETLIQKVPPEKQPKDLLQSAKLNSSHKNIYDNKLTLTHLTNQSSTIQSETPTLLPAAKSVVSSEDNKPTSSKRTVRSADTPSSLYEAYQSVALDAVSLIPPKPQQLIEAPERKLPELAYRKPKVKRLKFGLQLATVVNNSFKLIGNSFGIVFDTKIMRRIHLKSGVTYSFIKLKKRNSLLSYQVGDGSKYVDSYLEQVDVDAFLNSQDLDVNDLPEISTAFPIYSMDQLSFPLELQYQLSPAFRVGVGTQINWVINTEGREWSNSNIRQGSEDVLYIPSGEVLSKVDEGIRNVHFSASASAAYYPTTKLGIELRYLHGINDYTKESWWGNGQVDRLHYWQCALNYYF